MFVAEGKTATNLVESRRDGMFKAVWGVASETCRPSGTQKSVGMPFYYTYTAPPELNPLHGRYFRLSQQYWGRG